MHAYRPTTFARPAPNTHSPRPRPNTNYSFAPTRPEHQLLIRPVPNSYYKFRRPATNTNYSFPPARPEHQVRLPRPAQNTNYSVPRPAANTHHYSFPIHVYILPSIHPSIQHAGIDISIPKCMHRFSRSVIDSFVRSLSFLHLGGCQNYGPFLGPYYKTAPII